MNTRQLFLLGASTLASMLGWVATAQEAPKQYVQIAEIEIDPAQLEDYRAAVAEHAEAAIREEPGVLVLYAVSEKDYPTRIRVFEVYAKTAAYRAHLEAPHFKKYKAVTEKMVKSLRLVQTDPIALASKRDEHFAKPVAEESRRT
jgi:quinol monooxygenase YgiN